MQYNRYFIYLLLLFISTVFSQSINQSQPILKISFDDNINSIEYKAILGLKNVEIDEGKGVNGSAAIKVSYVGFNKGSERIVNSIRLPESYDEATLNYVVIFDKDFQFPRGGKLHGLGPVNKITGGRSIQKDGWSARVCFKRDGFITSYVYHQNMKGKYGEGKASKNFYFKKGQYYQIAIYVKINSPATTANGEVVVYVDGKELSAYKNLQLRAVDEKDSKINNFLFSTFHGGNSPDFAPKNKNGKYTTVYAWFDDFEIYKGQFIKGNNK
jgi:hypothetical protein